MAEGATGGGVTAVCPSGGLDVGVWLRPFRWNLPETPIPPAAWGLHSLPARPVIAQGNCLLQLGQSVAPGPWPPSALHGDWGQSPALGLGLPSCPGNRPDAVGVMTTQASGPLLSPQSPVSMDTRSIKCHSCAVLGPPALWPGSAELRAGCLLTPLGLWNHDADACPALGPARECWGHTGVLGAVGAPGFEQCPSHLGPVPERPSRSGTCLGLLFPAIFPDAPFGTHTWGQGLGPGFGSVSAWL